ncbi:MAG: ABC transporter substrate-binding protein [Pseudomonadota bacterium]
MRRVWAMGAALTLCGSVLAAEVPFFEDAVASGALPPVEDRLPATPLLGEDTLRRELGQYGGELKLLMSRSKDIRLMTVYGYARLVRYNDAFELVPDILESVDVRDGREFTLRLRPGHRWSDGHPFTSEDFRYYWDDVANDPELAAKGLPRELLVEGQRPTFDVIDEYTVRYTWPAPHPGFLLSLAGPRPIYIYRPAHFMRQFHKSYADPDELARKVEEASARNWSSLHYRNDRAYRANVPERPTLQPWRNTVSPPASRFVFERNAYFHRVDAEGRQLPYIDTVIVDITAKDLVPAKVASGDANLQLRYLGMGDYTFLREHELRGDYRVAHWRSGRGSELALYPNLNANDPAWRALNRSPDYRRALSLAIDRHEINEVIFFGLAKAGPNTVLPDSSLYDPAFDRGHLRDVDTANYLLDGLGLAERNRRGIRLLPDGRPMELIIHTAGERSAEVDMLELIRDHWQEIGIQVFIRPSQRDVFRKRVQSGDAVMSTWYGLDNALASADMNPRELAPNSDYDLNWPSWGANRMNGSGEAADDPHVRRLIALHEDWETATDRIGREAAWRGMLAIHHEQVFNIGTVSGVLQPVVISNRLHNVPVNAWYSWEPAAVFGVYRPDLFFFDSAGAS